MATVRDTAYALNSSQTKNILCTLKTITWYDAFCCCLNINDMVDGTLTKVL